MSTADVCFSVEKKIYRAAAFGRTVTGQVFDWMRTDSGKACLERADAELSDVVDKAMMYQIIHLWLPETLDNVYGDDMSLKQDHIQLMETMFPGSEYEGYRWMVQKGCYYGNDAVHI